MNRFNRHPSPAYRAFVATVQEYADADHQPGENVTRAIADALSAELRERFKASWEVTSTADTAFRVKNRPEAAAITHHCFRSVRWLENSGHPPLSK
jgi:hypothetical protein